MNKAIETTTHYTHAYTIENRYRFMIDGNSYANLKCNIGKEKKVLFFGWEKKNKLHSDLLSEKTSIIFPNIMRVLLR